VDSSSRTARTGRQARLGVFGVASVVIGLAANRRWLGALSPDGEIRNPFYALLILCFQVAMVGLGVWILALRNDPQRLRRSLLRLLLAMVSVGLFLVGFEVFLRVRPVSNRYALDLYSSDSRDRLRLKPNLRVMTRIGRQPIEIATNSRGMRWREPAPAKDPARTRIAFVGDSFTFGEWATSNAESFVGVFDSLAGRDHCEVLNFGVPSYGLVEERLQIQDDVLPLAPDYLFLMFCNGNDLSDTYLGPQRYRVKDGVAVWDTTFIGPRLGTKGSEIWGDKQRSGAGPHQLLGALRTVTFFADFYNTRQAVARRNTPEFVVQPSPLSFTYWSGVSNTEVRAAAVRGMQDELAAIAALCAAQGVRLVVVSVPFAEQVQAARPTGDTYDIRLPQRHVAEFAERQGIPYLDLLPLLRAYASRSGASLYCKQDPHFNNTGHLVTGIALAAYFRSLTGSAGTPRGAEAVSPAASAPAPAGG